MLQIPGWGWVAKNFLPGAVAVKHLLSILLFTLQQAFQKRESWFKVTLIEMYDKSGNERRHMNCEEHIPNPLQKKKTPSWQDLFH